MTDKKRGPKPSAPTASNAARAMGRRVEKLRNESGLKQGELADKVQITQQALSKIERGRINPDNPKSQGNIRKIAEFFITTAWA